MSSQSVAVKTGPVKFLEGFVIFFSGVDEVKRTNAKKFVIQCGGKCVDKYNNSVTCGIVGRVGASGYKDMLLNKVHIVSMRWLEDCSKQSSLVSLETAKYKVSPLFGLKVVCTQLNLDERNRMKHLVEKNGGSFSESFVGGVCTHLVAEVQEGDKFDAAKQCGNVKIVTKEWVERCSKDRAWIPEIDYPVKKKEEVIRKAAAAARIAATKKLAEHVIPSSGKVKNLVEDMEHCLIKQMGVSAFPSFLEVPKDSGMVFDGQLFLIKGYSQEVTDYLTSCILAGGGLRSMIMCDSVTAVVFGEETSQSDWTVARRHPCGVEYVNLVWVIEQLFSLAALRDVLQKTEPFVELFATTEAVHAFGSSLEDLCMIHKQSEGCKSEQAQGAEQKRKLAGDSDLDMRKTRRGLLWG